MSALRLPSRAHAEVVFRFAHQGTKGDIKLPKSELDAVTTLKTLIARLESIHIRAEQLAHSRSSDQKYIGDIAAMLEHWMIHGKT